MLYILLKNNFSSLCILVGILWESNVWVIFLSQSNSQEQITKIVFDAGCISSVGFMQFLCFISDTCFFKKMKRKV